ncbi:MAG: hypothetical protein PHH82_01210 [Candidatus ainarchaeum sp.]|nr:hypothetical protein [Candidatus ainarchaeum sp.]
MVLTSQQITNFNVFRVRLATSLRKMYDREANPHIRLMLGHVLRNVVLLPIHFREGHYLSANESGVTFGENVKRSFIEESNGMRVPHLESAIRVPSEHLFKGNNLNPAGVMTLLHEYSHIVLPTTAYRYTKRIGLPYHMADELFADLLAVRIANRTSIPKRHIQSHIIRRQANYGGYPFARAVIEGRRTVERELPVPRRQTAPREERPRNFIEIPVKRAEGTPFLPHLRRR